MKKSLCVLLSLIIAFSVAGVGATTAFADGGKRYVLRTDDLTKEGALPNNGIVAIREEVTNEDGTITVTKGTILQPGDSIVFCNTGSERKNIDISYSPYFDTDTETYIGYLGMPSNNRYFKEQVTFVARDTPISYTFKNIGENVEYAVTIDGVENTEPGEYPIDYTMQYHLFKGWEVTSCDPTGAKTVKITVAAVWEEDPNNPIPNPDPEPKTPFEEFIDKVKGYVVIGINVMILLLQGIVEYLETGEISIIKGLFGGGSGGDDPAPASFFLR